MNYQNQNVNSPASLLKLSNTVIKLDLHFLLQ